MKILFINYHDLDSNSGIHIFNIANHLDAIGIKSIVCVPSGKQATKHLGEASFETFDFDEAISESRRNSDELEFDLIHAWTPREVVRKFTDQLRELYDSPYIVHLEDNEEAITAANAGIPVAELRDLQDMQLEILVGDHISHPKRYRDFLSTSVGVTVIIDSLFKFKPEGVPGIEIWPGYQESFEWDLPINYGFRRQLGIEDHEFVLTYTGNVHSANRDEVLSLYLAVKLLNRKGFQTRLVRTGTDYVDIADGEILSDLQASCVSLGRVEREQIPSIIAMADALVQPGGSDPFNDFRFPSKLPEYLASGRPVLLPVTNIGRSLTDREDCILLERGNALEIAQKLELLMGDESLRKRIGHGGRQFAERNLRWGKSVEKLVKFYETIIGEYIGKDDRSTHLQPRVSTSQPGELNSRKNETRKATNRQVVFGEANFGAPNKPKKPPDVGVPTSVNLVNAYKAYDIQVLSHGTVRDYCDSLDKMPELATLQGDLKDMQRPWIIKAILAKIPPGSCLLEIGAGEPVVASLLARLGYEITIVDPYDGSSGGPTDYGRIVKEYPDIQILRGRFPDALQDVASEKFDGVYSVSVLEHIREHQIHEVLEGIRRLMNSDSGFSIHAIDHILRGWGEEYHLGLLRQIASGMGISETDLDSLLRQAERNPDTYFLSAKGHYLWKGNLPYEEFPMRRCISVNICASAFD